MVIKKYGFLLSCLTVLLATISCTSAPIMRSYERPVQSLPVSPSGKHLDKIYAILPLPFNGIACEILSFRLKTRAGAYVKILVGRPILDLTTEWWKVVCPGYAVISPASRNDPTHWAKQNGAAGWLSVELKSFNWGYEIYSLHNLIPFSQKEPSISTSVTIHMSLVDAQTGKTIAEATGSGKAPVMNINLNRDDSEITIDTARENVHCAVYDALKSACADLEAHLLR